MIVDYRKMRSEQAPIYIDEAEVERVESFKFLDKLAAIREVWEKWVERLPYLYNPGLQVTVNEQLVPFRGRCPFRQYMPGNPVKYGIKIWVACDAQSSYAWKMQVYTEKPTGGGPQKNQGMRFVLDVTDGLRGHNPELLPALLATRVREAFSSKFAFTSTTTLVSYRPKRNKNVVLLSTLHKTPEISDREDRKPAIILDYNHNKGGVDNLDNGIGTYSCRRM
ncbi:piggyBac transposable element-derived protein 4-like, partial [Salvelinus alpinus]|uniref:piggyBac transposable element-derived protein 4-like n=1 Tax=Salvelinus alpinus TaxID=8036 RepID=UPI0039FB8E6D